MKFTDALKGAIKKGLGIPAFITPQKADGSAAHIELSFMDAAPNGNNDTLTFSAEFRTAGTHKRWLENTVRTKRNLRLIEDSHLPVEIENGVVLRAYWKRSGSGGWVYNSESEGGMPAQYRAPYIVTIDCPARFFEEENGE